MDMQNMYKKAVNREKRCEQRGRRIERVCEVITGLAAVCRIVAIINANALRHARSDRDYAFRNWYAED